MAQRRKAPVRARTSGFQMTIRSTAQVQRELDRLAQLGLFGNSRAEVAEELMRAQLRQLHYDGWLGGASEARRLNREPPGGTHDGVDADANEPPVSGRNRG